MRTDKWMLISGLLFFLIVLASSGEEAAPAWFGALQTIAILVASYLAFVDYQARLYIVKVAIAYMVVVVFALSYPGQVLYQSLLHFLNGGAR